MTATNGKTWGHPISIIQSWKSTLRFQVAYPSCRPNVFVNRNASQVQVHQDIYFDDNRYRAQIYLAQALIAIMS